MADDFCKIFDRFIKVNGFGPYRDKKKRWYHRAGRMSSAEVITIMILFHLSGYKCLKHFYVNEVEENMTQIEHSRHRSVANFAVNLMAGLAAYSFFPKKPMIALERVSPVKGAVYNWKSFRYNSSNPR